MSPTTRIAVDVFWQYLAFAFNSLVFLLMGFEVSGPDLLSAWRSILPAFVVVTLGRAIVVAGVTGLLRRSRERLPWTWALRSAGAGFAERCRWCSHPLARVRVSAPSSTGDNDVGVVILSILAQGLTMAPLLRWLRVVERRDVADSHRFVAKLSGHRRRGRVRERLVGNRLTLGHVMATPVFDAVASISIGLVLVAEAGLLGFECRGLIIGEAARPLVIAEVRRALARHPEIGRIVELRTLQLGPDSVMLVLGILPEPTLTIAEIERLTAALAAELRALIPTIKHIVYDLDARHARVGGSGR